MKPIIIDIDSISKAIPKYRTWYRYYDDILVSVICIGRRKSHIKRKTKSIGQKSDNDLCFWHSDWQYNKIENYYGREKTGNQSYEIIVKYEGEIHRIDSVVNNIAIEFQHSLNVSINEMESRYNAHKALGYTPYLILDFTDYSSSDTLLKLDSFSISRIDDHINRNFKNELICSFLRKLKKWTLCQYFTNENLFIDFSDQIIRFTPRLNKKFLIIEKLFFLENILQLEEVLIDAYNQKREQQELEKQRKLVEEQRKEEENQKRIEKSVAEAKLLYKEKISKNRREIESGKDFEYYRRCLKNKLIDDCIEKLYYIEYVGYKSYSKKENDIHKKYHIYSIFRSEYSKPEIELQYITVSKVNGKEFKYLHTDINLIKKIEKGLKRFTFKSETDKKIYLTSKRIELVQGILHSTNLPALWIYDKNENLISSDFYLFNNKVNKEEFSELSLYFEYGHFSDDTENQKLIELRTKIVEEDEFDFRRYYYEGEIPDLIMNFYYASIKEKQPLTENAYP